MMNSNTRIGRSRPRVGAFFACSLTAIFLANSINSARALDLVVIDTAKQIKQTFGITTPVVYTPGTCTWTMQCSYANMNQCMTTTPLTAGAVGNPQLSKALLGFVDGASPSFWDFLKTVSPPSASAKVTSITPAAVTTTGTACPTNLVLDNYIYPLAPTADVKFYGSALVATPQAQPVCSSARGPISTIGTSVLALNTTIIGLQQLGGDTGMNVVSTPTGVNWYVKSTNGDVVCTGGTPFTGDRLFSNGFEPTPPAMPMTVSVTAG